MRPAFISFLLAASILVSAGTLGAKPRLVDSVMPLTNQEHQNFCTAFNINEKQHLWVTAGHCVAVAYDRGWELKLGGEWVVIQFYWFDEAHDIAVLKAAVTAEALNLAKKAPEVGTKLEVWGHPYGLPVLVRARGILAAKGVPIPGRALSDILDLTVAGGNSGSPVLDTKDRVIGVLWGKFIDSSLSLSIPYESIKQDIGIYWNN